MIYSKIALYLLAAQEIGMIKSNAAFYKDYISEDVFMQHANSNPNLLNAVETLKQEIDLRTDDEGIVCCFDDDFPVINRRMKSNKPYLLFYKGNISLLKDLNNNVAVIGLVDPTEEIEDRERKIVNKLVADGLVVVSGLAKGCDSVAHRICVENNCKTIAILPSPINKIYPAKNKPLAQEIVNTGGLLISEYFREPRSKWESVGRFVERDRLQALFSKAIILIASYKENEGDSGSRHAMKNALEYGIKRYVLYNEQIDRDNPRFGLNREYLVQNAERTLVLTQNSIIQIKDIYNNDLVKNNYTSGRQMSFQI